MNKYITEFIGTFFLVMGAAFAGGPGAALALMIMVYAGGHISGGHYNPAVTLAVWMRGKIEMKDAVMYWIFQVIGGVAAAVGSPVVGASRSGCLPGGSAFRRPVEQSGAQGCGAVGARP